MKENEQKNSLQEQYEYMKTIINSFSHPFYVIDANTHKIKIANQFARSGQNIEDITCYELTHLQDKPCSGDHACPLEEVKRTKKHSITEHVHHDKEGNKVYVEVHGYPIFDKDGNVVEMVEYSYDISERKKTEKTLKENIAQFQMLLEHTSDMVTINGFSFDVPYIYVNPAFEKFVGRTKEELIGKSGAQFVHPDDMLRMMPLLRKYVTGKIKGIFKKNAQMVYERLEYRLKYKDGNWHDIESSANVGAGNTLLFISRDITERKKEETTVKKQLEESRIFMKATRDRENRIIELKKEINKLSDELGRPEPYDLSFVSGE